MSDPAKAVQNLIDRLAEIRARREAIYAEEQEVRQEINQIQTALALAMRKVPVRASKETQADRILSAVCAAGRAGVTRAALQTLLGAPMRSMAPELTRLKNRGLIARREGTKLWVAVTPSGSITDPPADGPVS